MLGAAASEWLGASRGTCSLHGTGGSGSIKRGGPLRPAGRPKPLVNELRACWLAAVRTWEAAAPGARAGRVVSASRAVQGPGGR